MTIEVAASVIVSTRNRAHYLNDCLHSLSRQNCDEKFEVLVVDNGSTDETPQLIQEWCRKQPHYCTLRETRIGLSAAKNAGGGSARGQLLLFTDDDVILDPNWVRAYLDLFRRIGQEKVIAAGPIVPILNDLSVWPNWFDTAALPELGLLDYQAERPLHSWEYGWGANLAIPASIFRKIGPWNEELGRRGEDRGTFEDTEYQDRVRAAGGTVWFCAKAVLHHRIEPERIRPRQIMARAFSRGRNEFLRDVLRAGGSLQNPQRENAIARVPALAFSLTGWLCWTMVFSLIKKPGVFRRTHDRAFSSGKNMERARAGRETGPLFAPVVRGTSFVRKAVLLLTTDTTE